MRKPGSRFVRTWDGGFVQRDSKGREVFVIRKMIGGKRFVVSTRAHSEAAAVAQLKRFEADPEGYTAAGEAPRDGLYLDAPMVARFLAFSASKGNGANWIDRQTTNLAWWGKALAGHDLRKLTRETIRLKLGPDADALRHRQRVAVLKALTSWLRRREGLLTAAEDALADWALPKVAVAQDSMSKIIDLKTWEKVRAWLLKNPRQAPRGPFKDGTAWDRAFSAEIMVVQLGTGWHVAESVRFALSGEIIPHAKATKVEAGVLITPKAKRGTKLASRVSARVLQAAAKLQAIAKPLTDQKQLSIERQVYEDIHAAQDALAKESGQAVQRFQPGWARHTVASFAMAAQGDARGIAAALGNSEGMIRRVYVNSATSSPKIPTPV